MGQSFLPARVLSATAKIYLNFEHDSIFRSTRCVLHFICFNMVLWSNDWMFRVRLRIGEVPRKHRYFVKQPFRQFIITWQIRSIVSCVHILQSYPEQCEYWDYSFLNGLHSWNTKPGNDPTFGLRVMCRCRNVWDTITWLYPNQYHMWINWLSTSEFVSWTMCRFKRWLIFIISLVHGLLNSKRLLSRHQVVCNLQPVANVLHYITGYIALYRMFTLHKITPSPCCSSFCSQFFFWSSYSLPALIASTMQHWLVAGW